MASASPGAGNLVNFAVDAARFWDSGGRESSPVRPIGPHPAFVWLSPSYDDDDNDDGQPNELPDSTSRAAIAAAEFLASMLFNPRHRNFASGQWGVFLGFIPVARVVLTFHNTTQPPSEALRAESREAPGISGTTIFSETQDTSTSRIDAVHYNTTNDRPCPRAEGLVYDAVC
ncbi:predicted protein [Histoplasma capsulatum G186AR]|uniref:Uncharacterized protein n=1 Tax=Ajellomyces capsulatus (strain G186AR / H82 / ATCC MYA-2454 / RMSCC 2432) TaxID=447093 RepID=C0NYZ0_AJECG|nr:uncharacterized protein HCBG_08370 [Histoplasma capsulatum G186AR]EEH03430.1 predicted protein [Histoplasma capsulatum G186AR]